MASSVGSAVAAAGVKAAARPASIVWFKATDLRLRDHEPLFMAHKETDGPVLNCFIFDPFWFGKTSFGFAKTGHYRARFLLESVADLRKNLKAAGSNLIIRTGPSAAVLAGLAAAHDVTAVYTHAEVTSEELKIDHDVIKELAKLPKKPTLKRFWGNTLYHLDDVPFRGLKVAGLADREDAKLPALPQVFTHFRKAVEGTAPVRDEIPVPSRFKPCPIPAGPAIAPPKMEFAPWAPSSDGNTGEGKVPSLMTLGVPDLATQVANTLPGFSGWEKVLPAGSVKPAPAAAPAPPAPGASAGWLTDEEALNLPPTHDARGVLQFRGGETAALGRMKTYFWDRNALKDYKETRNGMLGADYKETRNGMLGADYSSKFSPWLALGNISPRTIHAEVKRYESKVIANESTYWLLFELLWRDYFHFAAIGWRNSLFFLWGPRNSPDPARVWRRDPRYMTAWSSGTTGWPFVDANMRELLLTGFMSNRGRQNVASFFTKDLDMDWRLGAEWFESTLIDHDPCSNYGNWTYVAGVGADPREDRYFLLPKQSRSYDKAAEFMKTWCPLLRGLPADKVHDPTTLPAAERPEGYPAPIVKLLAQRQGRETGPFSERPAKGGASGGGGGNGGSAQKRSGAPSAASSAPRAGGGAGGPASFAPTTAASAAPSGPVFEFAEGHAPAEADGAAAAARGGASGGGARGPRPKRSRVQHL